MAGIRAGKLLLSIAGVLMFWAAAAYRVSGQAVPGHFPDPQPLIAGEVTVPFEFYQQHIYLSLSLQGRPGFVFLLDSGASRNILSLHTARQLGFHVQDLSQEKSIGYGNGLIYVGPEEKIQVGLEGVLVANRMSVMDLNQFERHFHHTTDGLLGYPFFKRFVIRIDYQKRLITLRLAEKYRYRGPGSGVRLAKSKHFVVMPVQVGSGRGARHHIRLVVDTGSNVALMLYQQYVHGLNLDSSLLRADPGKAYGLNGYYSVSRGILSSLLIGDALAHSVAVDYMQDEDDSTREVQGAIGNGILQCFQAVIFDVPQQRIYFEVAPPPWQPGVVRTAGPG